MRLSTASPVILLVAIAFANAPRALADDLRDPTRPPAPAHREAVPAEPAPVLSAVMGTGTDRVAIFNGHVVRSGGAVGPYVIDSVFEDGVRYRHAGVTRELYLPRNAPFKKPAAARPTAGVQ